MTLGLNTGLRAKPMHEHSSKTRNIINNSRTRLAHTVGLAHSSKIAYENLERDEFAKCITTT